MTVVFVELALFLELMAKFRILATIVKGKLCKFTMK